MVRISMDTWLLVRWCLLLTGGLAAVFGLHRLALRMEQQGHIYYVNKKPSSSSMGSFVALQRAIEPRAEHVLQVSRVNHIAGNEGASGKSQEGGLTNVALGSTQGSTTSADVERK
jgi:hypothetical protein